jgi:hypothetical protein
MKNAKNVGLNIFVNPVLVLFTKKQINLTFLMNFVTNRKFFPRRKNMQKPHKPNRGTDH